MQTRRTILAGIHAMLFLHCASAQAPAIEWKKTLGGTENDVTYSIQQTADGGYVLAGGSQSNDGDVTGHHGSNATFDCWVVKLDGSGNLQWQRSLGGTRDDYANSIQQTADGGYIVAGYSHSNDGDVTGHHGAATAPDYWVVKLDDSGNIEWQRSLGGTGTDKANSVQQTTDGGYIVAGTSDSNNGDVTGWHEGFVFGIAASDYWVVKLNNTGDIEWQKSLGGSGGDAAYSIQQTTDGGYIVAGYSGSVDGDVTGNHGGGDYWIVKLNSNGNVQWQKALGGTAGDFARSARQTTDGGYIIAGYSGSSDGDAISDRTGVNYWVVKTDDNGNLQWQNAFGGRTFTDTPYSVQQTSDGGYIVAGYTYNNNEGDVGTTHGAPDYWVVKTDGSGNLQWQKPLGGSGNNYGYAAQQTTDGGYIVAGYTTSNDGDVSGNHGKSDLWIVKLAATAGLEEPGNNYFYMYPNPAGDFVTITNVPDGSTVTIADITGKVLYNFFAAHKQETVNTAALSSGIYLVWVESNGSIRYKKFIVNK